MLNAEVKSCGQIYTDSIMGLGGIISMLNAEIKSYGQINTDPIMGLGGIISMLNARGVEEVCANV